MARDWWSWRDPLFSRRPRIPVSVRSWSVCDGPMVTCLQARRNALNILPSCPSNKGSNRNRVPRLCDDAHHLLSVNLWKKHYACPRLSEEDLNCTKIGSIITYLYPHALFARRDKVISSYTYHSLWDPQQIAIWCVIIPGLCFKHLLTLYVPYPCTHPKQIWPSTCNPLDPVTLSMTNESSNIHSLLF